MTDAEFLAWAAQSDSVKIYLVELEGRRKSDGAAIPLYLASQGLTLEERHYLGVNLGLPDLIRQANDTRDLSSIPTWGELEISYEPEDKADAAGSLTWSQLLSQDYTFANRPLKILLGGEGFAYADFRVIFSGYIMDRKAGAAKITFRVYDKCRYLETIKVPAEPLGLTQPPVGSGKRLKNLAARLAAGKLPKTSHNNDLPDANKGKQLPLVLGRVKNYHPSLIDDVLDKFALAGHVIHQVLAVRGNGELLGPQRYTFKQRDLSPAEKDGDGAAWVSITGPYTGSAWRRTWIAQIDSVEAGKEVGEATFRWSKDGGATWEAAGQPTRKLQQTPVLKTPGGEPPSDGVMTLSGTYTSLVIRPYVVLITLAGAVGEAKFKWSHDGGATWSAEILTAAAPIALEYGLSVAFENTFDLNDQWDWTYVYIPIPLGEGISIQFLSVGGQDDFELWDLWGWFLCSTLDCGFQADENILSVDVEGLVTGTGSYIYKAADLIKELLTTYAGWDPNTDLDAASFAAFNTTFPYGMGYKSDSPTEIRKIIDALLGGLPAYYAVGLDGKFRLGEITEPAGTPALLLEDPRDALDLEEESKAQEIIYRVHLNYDRNWAPGQYKKASKTAQQWLKDEWREVEDRDETIREDYPLAQVLEPIDTCLINKADAEAVAAQVLALWSIERRPLTFKCKIQPFYQDQWILAQMTSPLFGLAGGGLFLLPGMHLDFTANEAELNLWR
jgi:hypothetical protein